MQKLYMDNAQNGVDSSLYERFAVTIFQYLCQQVSNEQDAEDLLLEVFLAAFQDESLSNLPAERQLAWLRRAARNKVVIMFLHLALLYFIAKQQTNHTEAG